MIFDRTIKESTAVDTELDNLLENAEDRFEYETMAEATAIIVTEHEQNWNTFMEAVGMQELDTVLEGGQVIYEGARLEGLAELAKKYFNKVLEKLAQLTAFFNKKIDEVNGKIMAFYDKYAAKLRAAKLPEDLFKDFKGYTFEGLKDAPKYDLPNVKYFEDNGDAVISNKEKYNKQAAEEYFVKDAGDKSIKVALKEKFYGSKEKTTMKVDVSEQLDILKETKGLKKDAKSSFVAASKEIKKIIKSLESLKKEAKKESNTEAAKMSEAAGILVSFWKSYAQAAQQVHGVYMGALGARAKQAFGICTKAAMAARKVAKKEEKPEVKNEGFVNTEAFLGATEFI